MRHFRTYRFSIHRRSIVRAFGSAVIAASMTATLSLAAQAQPAPLPDKPFCLNTVDTIERETGKRPEIIPVATPVQVGAGQILALIENGYTLVRP